MKNKKFFLSLNLKNKKVKITIGIKASLKNSKKLIYVSLYQKDLSRKI